MTGSFMGERVMVIAGVGEGLGRDLALEAAGSSTVLVLLARRPDVIASLAAEIEQLGSRALPIVCDITSAEQCDEAIARSVTAFGHVDTLINVAHLSEKSGPVLDTPADFTSWRSIFDVNVFGAMGMLRAAARQMVEQRSGTIVMINSMAAERLRVGRAAYQGSKAALATMSKTAALELAQYNIRINSLHPGFMAGEPIEKAFRFWAEQNGTNVEEERAKVLATIPLGYIPPTAEYARVALFLASDFSAPMTGQSVHANGGQWLH